MSGAEAGIGHNSARVPGEVAADEIRAFLERIERLTEEKKALQGDISEVYGEAKGHGYDTRTLRTVVKIRAQDRDKRKEEQELLDLYLGALGML